MFGLGIGLRLTRLGWALRIVGWFVPIKILNQFVLDGLKKLQAITDLSVKNIDGFDLTGCEG